MLVPGGRPARDLERRDQRGAARRADKDAFLARELARQAQRLVTRDRHDFVDETGR